MNYWLLSSGKDGELWPTFWNYKVVALGWSKLGDLRNYKTWEELKDGLMKTYPDAKSGSRRNWATQLWGFYQSLQVGELVFVRSYGAIIGIGEVQSDYEFLSEGDELKKRTAFSFL